MISTRAAISGGVAVVGLAVLLGPRLPDPAVEIGAERLVQERAAVAERAADELHGAVLPALDAGRAAAAAVVSSDDPPGSELIRAAQLVADAEALVPAARRALVALDGARNAWRPAATPLEPPVSAGELTSIADQLAAAAEPADAFAERRVAAIGLPAILDRALDAIDRGALVEAGALIAEARADHDTIVAWDTGLSTLPVWIETAGGMISAVEAILDAAHRGDPAAGARAADAFAALATDAATADRALRIALGEAGPALTAAPLQRLAIVLGEIEAARATVAAMAVATSQ